MRVLERGVEADERRSQPEVIGEPREEPLVQRRQFAVLGLRIPAVDTRDVDGERGAERRQEQHGLDRGEP